MLSDNITVDVSLLKGHSCIRGGQSQFGHMRQAAQHCVELIKCLCNTP